jgi:hypothetical protein
MTDGDAVSAHRDARGVLIAVEIPELSFAVQRVFTVVGPEGGADRGDHVVPCDQLMVLVSGAASVRVGPSVDDATVYELDTPGATVRLRAGEHVRYRLADEGSSVMVLASEIFKHGERE